MSKHVAGSITRRQAGYCAFASSARGCVAAAKTTRVKSELCACGARRASRGLTDGDSYRSDAALVVCSGNDAGAREKAQRVGGGEEDRA